MTEWQYHLRKRNPLKPEGWVTKYRMELEAAFPEGLIADFNVTRPEWLTDINNAHVHSAAVVAGVGYLVTDDDGWGNAPGNEIPYEVHSSDSFLCLCVESQPVAMGERVAAQLAHAWRRRSGDAIDLSWLTSGDFRGW